jgi:hypothetical protein
MSRRNLKTINKNVDRKLLLTVMGFRKRLEKRTQYDKAWNEIIGD